MSQLLINFLNALSFTIFFCLLGPDADQDPSSKKTKFQCDSCDYTTARANLLRHHKESMHQDISWQDDIPKNPLKDNIKEEENSMNINWQDDPLKDPLSMNEGKNIIEGTTPLLDVWFSY